MKKIILIIIGVLIILTIKPALADGKRFILNKLEYNNPNESRLLFYSIDDTQKGITCYWLDIGTNSLQCIKTK